MEITMTSPESGTYKFRPLVSFKRRYFENSILCGYCNGAGVQGYMDYCRACVGKGIETLNQFLSMNDGDRITLAMLYKQCYAILEKESETAPIFIERRYVIDEPEFDAEYAREREADRHN